MRQILVETHNAPMPNAQNFFFNLHDVGFVIFSKEANYENGAGGVEYAFVKLSIDFFINDTMYYKMGWPVSWIWYYVPAKVELVDTLFSKYI